MSNWELAQCEIKQGHDDAFEVAMREGAELLRKVKGCHSVVLHRGVDAPGRFLLMIEWDSVDYHLNEFVGSERARELSALLAPHLAERPQAFHSVVTDVGF